MPAPVVVNFQVGGLAQMGRAFQTTEQALLRAERAAEKAAQRETATKAREYAKSAKAAEKAARDEVRSTQKSEKDKSRAVEDAAKDKIRSMMRADKIAAQIMRQSVRDTEQTEREKNASAMKWVRKRENEDVSSARRSLNARGNMLRAIGGSAATGLMNAGRRIGGISQAIAGSVMQLGGGFSIADSVQRSTALTGKAADLANAGQNATSGFKENAQKQKTSAIVDTARAVSAKTGYTADEGVEGMSKFVAVSGDLKTARETLMPLAELSRATGAGLDDMAAAAGNVAAVLPDTADKGERVMQIMRGIAGQGKMGAVEIKDLSTQMAKLVATAGKFEGDNVENILKMGAIAQAARGGGGAWSAASATTAVNSFSATFGKGARRKEFAAHGIAIDGADGKVRAPELIIADSIAKTGGDIKQMNDLFGSVMGDRAVAKFTGVYKEAGKGLTGKAKEDAGRKAVKDQFDDYLKKAPMDKASVTKAASERMGENDMKIATTMADFDKAVEDQLIPELMKLIPVLKEMLPIWIGVARDATPAFVGLIRSVASFATAHKGIIDSIAANPLGSIIAFEVTKSIAAASLGEVLKGLFAKMAGGAGGGGAGGLPGAGGGMGAMGGLAVGAGIGIAATAAYKPGIDAALDGSQSSQFQVGQLIAEAKSGDPAQLAHAQKMMEEAGSKTSKLGIWADVAALPFGAANQATGGKNFAADDLKKQFAAREIVNSEELKKAISDAVVGGVAQGMASKADPKNPTRVLPQVDPARH